MLNSHVRSTKRVNHRPGSGDVPENYQHGQAESCIVLQLATPVEPIRVSGRYNPATSTWSNREFEGAALKKHNEDM